VDLQSGKRAWESEVSSIDTSILMMGVLSAGQYFGGEIEAKTRQIYEAVNWLCSWMTPVKCSIWPTGLRRASRGIGIFMRSS